MYGLATGASVGNLFIAGIVPGCIIALCLISYAVYYCKKHGEDREKLMENKQRLRKNGLSRILKDSFFAILTPVIILGGIYGGVVTPTEAAGISVIYAIIVAMFIYRTVTLKDLYAIYVESAKTVAPIMIVNLAIGFVTPPIGLNLYVASSMTKLPVIKIAKNAVPFLIAFVFALLLITYIPQFSLALLG